MAITLEPIVLPPVSKIQGEEALRDDLEILNSKLQQTPQDSISLYNKANILRIQGNYEEAIDCYQKAIQYTPNYLDAHYNLGLTYYSYNKIDVCLEKLMYCLFLNEHLPLYGFIGRIYYHKGRYSEALHFLSKCLLKNESIDWEIYFLIGNIHYSLGAYEAAFGNYIEALKINKTSFDLLFSVAITLEAMCKFDDSIVYYKKAYELNKDNIQVFFRLNFLLRQTCSWLDQYYFESDKLGEIIKRKTGVVTEEIPWICAVTVKDDEICLLTAKEYAKKLELQCQESRFYPESIRTGSKKIKIGYLSSDFFNHATSHLMLEMFSNHCKNNFEVYTFYYGNVYDEYTDKIKNASDRFFNTFNLSNYESAKLIYDHKIDILIDLKGYTQSNRCEILAYHPCLTQIHYLGFAGSLGANFINYFIADETTIPKENLKYFHEDVLYMPDTYQVNGKFKSESKKQFSRSQLGLSENRVVFCCFNQPYKIDRETVDAWCAILSSCDNSVLLLLDHNATAKKNLLEYMKKYKLKDDRIIFLPNIPIPEHLARLQSLADVALDCFICNGHTTTSDALYANVPVITVKGQHFSSRVSESLLKALGLDELIFNSAQEYISFAISLANDGSKIKNLKKKLKINIKEHALFDIKKFMRNFEKLLLHSISRNIDNAKVTEQDKNDVLKINLGCGFNVLEGWVNVDSQNIPGAIQFDLNEIPNKKLPFAENSIDEFLLSHVLEHLQSPLAIMEELYRVAKPNAEMVVRVPYGSSDDAFEDPTHLRQYFLNSFLYFSQPAYFKADYQYRGDWQVKSIELFVSEHYKNLPYLELLTVINQYRNIVSEMVVTLKAIKPLRAPKWELQEYVQPIIHYCKI